MGTARFPPYLGHRLDEARATNTMMLAVEYKGFGGSGRFIAHKREDGDLGL